MNKPRAICFDGWTLHRESGELEREGKRVRLQDVPLQILDELLSRPGEVVTREQLIAHLWPKTVVDFDGNLNSGVRRLRAALADDADAPRYIETLPRKGYRYIGEAPRVLAPEPSIPPASVTGEPLSSPQAMAAGSRSKKRSRLLLWGGVSAVVLVAALVAGVAWVLWGERSRRPADYDTAAVTPVRPPRLAVLPFANLSPNPSNAFFADGLHEEMLSTIASRSTKLEVISRTTMMAYRAFPRPVQDIARELNASHVLEGSVRRDGESVRLTLQLIDARNDNHLWSQSFDRQLRDTLRLQKEVAEEVSSRLAVTMSGNIGELPASTDPQAYDLYLQALLAMRTVNARRSPREQDKAEGLLNRAIERDPAFGAAYLERARVRMTRFVSSQDVSEGNLQALRADLAAARSEMGDSAPLLTSEAEYAQLVDFETAKALRLLAVAQAMNPNSSEAYLYFARTLPSAGKPLEALTYFKQAATLDPGNPAVFADWAAALKMSRRAAESLQVSRDFDARYPGLTTYGWRLFGFTGQLDRFRNDMARAEESGDPDAQLSAHFDLLLFSRQFADIAELIEKSGLTSVRQVASGGFTIPSVGRKPVAELRGWGSLLQRDVASAASDGRALLEFVAHEPVTKWNAWYLKLLAAEGALFTGDKARAAEGARSALAVAPPNVHPGIQRYSSAQAARVLAWAGAEDEAVNLLVQLSTSFPSIGPAEITRDPLYSTPLAGNARYEALEQKLEAEIAANQRLRDRGAGS